MMIAGLENHKKLYTYVEKVDKRILENDDEDAKVNLRKCAECIVNEYIKEYPLCAGDSLFNSIKLLSQNEIISRKEANLLHAIRKTGNAGGAHVTDTFEDDDGNEVSEVYESEIDRVRAVYGRLLAYLPEFLQKFPVPSQKPIPRPGSSLGNTGINIDYSAIQPLKLHPDWRKAVGYDDFCTFMVDVRDRDWFLMEKEEIRAYISEALNKEIHVWQWLADFSQGTWADYVSLIVSKDDGEYLDIAALVKYYEHIVKDYAAKENFWDDWWNGDLSGWPGYYYFEPFHIKETGIETSGIYIPAIIQPYFPGSVCRFLTGKGLSWNAHDGNYGKLVNTLVNGEEAVIVPEVKRYYAKVEADKRAWAEEWKRKQQEREAWLRDQPRREAAQRQAAERAAQLKKEQEEQRRRESVETEAKEKQKKVLKVVKIIALLYAFFIVLGIVMIVLQNLGKAKLGIDILIVAVIAFLVIRKKKKGK